MDVENTDLNALAGPEFKEFLKTAEAVWSDQTKELRQAGACVFTMKVSVGREKDDMMAVSTECEIKVPKYKGRGVFAYRSKGSGTGWAHTKSNQPPLPFTYPETEHLDA